MYTWGYTKDVSLAKLDLDEMEATEQDLISRFPFYANEVITQICSTVKPKHSFAQFVVKAEDVNKVYDMPEDFVAFDDDVNTRYFKDEWNDTWVTECHDDDLTFKGYNQIVFHKVGTYTISYKARWFTFDKDMDNDTVINIPTDVLECIPSYIAHQCYKIDDEVKSAIFRNEYEIFLARIDDTNYKRTSTFKIGGDW